MAAESGNNIVLQIGDGASPEVFTTIAGMRSNSMQVANDIVDITTKDSNHYREILSGGGNRKMTMNVSGIFNNAASEELLRNKAFANVLWGFKMIIGASDYVIGDFLISSYERTGEYDGNVTFSATLESSGAWAFTAA